MMWNLHKIVSLCLSTVLVLSLSIEKSFRNVVATTEKQNGRLDVSGIDMFPDLMDPTYSMLSEILASQVVSKNEEFRDLQSTELSNSDLTELNDFLEGLIIKLPDQDSYEQVNFTALPNANLATRSFSLKEINIDRITDQQAPTIIKDIADDKYNYVVQVNGLDLVASLDFEFDTGLPFEFLQLCGALRVEVEDCTAKFDIAFKSEDLDVYPPSYAELERCRLDINVELIKFTGKNALFDIINQFESLARPTVEDLLDSIVCNLIRDAVSGSITSTLRRASNAVNPYTDPNFGQANELIDSEVAAFQKAQDFDSSAVDFSNTDSPVGGIINFLILLVDRFLSSEVEDTENTDGKSRDLGVNTLLRSNVLDEDRKFVWEDEVVLFENNTVLFTKLVLERAEVLGLDTFTSFTPLQAASQTLSSNFEIPSVQFDIILRVELDTGSNPENDALLMFIPDKFTDRISLSIEFTEIFLNASAYIVLEESKLQNINLGSFLNTTNLLPCSLASMKDFRLDSLEGAIDINTPRMDRFIDEAIGLLMNNIFDAISFMSDAVLANALPRYMSTTGKQNITDIAKFAISNITAENCPTFFSTPDAFIDFRDLLLEEDAAKAAGASGTLPYGDVCPFVKKIIDENFVLPDEDGSPTINSLVANATAGQSGTEGSIKLNQTVDLALCLPDLLANFGLQEVFMENLDTFDYPFEIFSPTAQNVLSNRFVLGNEERPLRVGVRFATSINSTSRELNEKNEFALTIDMSKLEVVFAVIAKFYEESFMQFPVNNMANVDCWLASLPDYKGTNERALGIDELELSFEDLMINLDCIDCSSQRDLPAVLEILKGLDGFDLAIRSLITFAKEYILSIGNREAINEMIHNAPKKCPHHPAFEGSVDEAERPFVALLALAASGLSNLGQQEEQSSEDEAEEQQGPICIGLPSGGGDIVLPFSRDAHESLIFLTLLLVEMFMATLSLSTVNTLDFSPSNPLEIQETLSTTKTESLLDISNLNATFLNWLDGPLKQGNATVSNLIDDPTHENGKDIGANVYIRRVLSEDGSLTIPINFELNSTTVKMPLSVNYVKLIGLDSFTKVVLMKTIGPQTLQSEFELGHLDVELSLSITSPSSQPRSADFISTSATLDTITEEITISFGMTDISFDLGLFLGLDEEAFRTFNLGSVFDTNQLLSCLMTVVDDVRITRLLMSVGGVKDLEVEGFLSEEVKNVVVNFQSILFDSFEEDILASIPILSDGILREIGNGAINSFISNTSACNLFQQSSGDGFVDFRDLFLPPEISLLLGGSGTQPYGNIWSTIYGLAKTFLFDPNENGVPKISDILIGPWTSGQSNETGTLIFKDPVVDSSFDLSRRFRSEGFLNLTALYDTTIRGLDGINNPLVLLAPVGAHLLNNSFSFGSELRPVEIKTTANLSVVDGEGVATTNTFDIALAFPKIGLEALLKAKISEKAFMGFPFEDVVNVDCWIASLPSRELDQFGIAIEGEDTFAGIDDIRFILEQSSIEITCRQCDDPELQYYAEMFTGVSFTFFTQNFLTSGAIQNVIDKSIFSSVRKCPHSPEYDPEFVAREEEGPIFDRLDAPDSGFSSTNTFIILAASFTALFTITYCAGYIVNRSTKRKHAMWLASLSDNEILTLYMEHNHEREQQKELSRITSSMFTSPEIPAILRYGTPMVVVLNVGLFISGHLNLGATIDVTFFFAGQPFTIEGLYTYAILTLVEDMWKNAIKSLAGVVFLCSVLWPYTKQTISFLLWFAPPYLVSVQRRGAIYRYLDFLAKWSMIDIFIIIIGMVVFRVVLTSGPNFPEDYFGLDLVMIPLWGIFANMLAQIVSQISSHWIIYYQDKITMKALIRISEYDESSDTDEMSGEDVENVESFDTFDQQYGSGSGSTIEEVRERRMREREIALYNHCFYLSGEMRGNKLKIKNETNIFVGFVGLLTIFCIIYGTFARYLRIDMTGFLAGLISAGNDGAEPVIHHSVITVAQTMLGVGDFVGTTPAKVGVAILSFVMVATCAVVPTLQCLCVLALYFVPLTQKRRSHLIWAIEILKAWQYLEVYFLGTLVMMWQANPISESLVLIVCWGLRDFFASLAEFGVLSEQQSRCFLINASLELSVIIHIAAGVLLWWITKFVSNAVEQQSEDLNIRYKAHGIKKESDQVFGESAEVEKNFEKIISDLVHLPVRFTDAYPWAMRERIVRSNTLTPSKDVSPSIGENM